MSYGFSEYSIHFNKLFSFSEYTNERYQLLWNKLHTLKLYANSFLIRAADQHFGITFIDKKAANFSLQILQRYISKVKLFFFKKFVL